MLVSSSLPCASCRRVDALSGRQVLVSHWSRNFDRGCWEFGNSPHRVFDLCIPVEVNMNVVVSFEFVVDRDDSGILSVVPLPRFAALDVL